MCGALRVCWSWEWELLRVIGVELELRAVGVELLRPWWYWCRVSARRRQTIVVSTSVRVVCVEIRSLYFSCDLLIVLLLFSLLPIYFYFEKRVGFRSLTTKQDSFPTGGVRTWQCSLAKWVTFLHTAVMATVVMCRARNPACTAASALGKGGYINLVNLHLSNDNNNNEHLQCECECGLTR